MSRTTRCLAICLTTVCLVATANGQWSSVGPFTKDIRAITAAPGGPDTLFAGAFGWGLFVSTNGALSWTNYSAGLTNTYLRSVAARSTSVLVCGTNDNIARSTDGGITWTVVQATAFSVRAVAYDPVTGHWYAGTYGDGFYRSTNDGVTWTKHVVTDPVSGQTLHHIRALGRFGADSLYAGGSISDIASGGALFVSLDGGQSWTQVQRTTGVRSSVTSISISPNTPSTSLIFATAAKGLYKSTDGGLTILNINADTTPGPLPDTNLSTSAFSPAYRMAGSDSLCGVYLRPLGDTLLGWQTAAGLPGAPAAPRALQVNPSGARVLAGLEDAGIFRSLDSGHTFAVSSSGLLETDVRALIFASGGRLVAATGFGDQILYSDNVGATWQHAGMTSFNSLFSMARATNGDLYAAQYATGVLRSTDQGATWNLTDTLVVNSFVRAVAADPFSASTVYAGTGSGVFKSTNAGLTWAAVNNGTIPASTSVRALDVSPSASGLVLAGSDSSFLYRSTNGGINWTHLDSLAGFRPSDAFIRTLHFDAARPGFVYAGCDGGRIYRSTNSGVAWSLLVDLPGSGSVREIAIDPTLSTRVFAATFGSGLFVTEDDGLHWQSYNTGLPDLQVSTVAIQPASSPLVLWVGTGHRGAFHRTYTGLPANQAPTLVGPASKIVSPGNLLSISYVALDPNLADTLQFSKSGPGTLVATPGYSPDTAVVSWTPAAADTLASPYSLRVIVGDGHGLFDTVVTTVTVTAGQAFMRGDVNADGKLTSSDIIGLVNYVFKGGPPPQPVVDVGDVNCDGRVTSSDVIFLVNHIFKGAPAPSC
jgi:photosystem II stability/assembly factor-like uncharacterized protein